MSFRLGGAIAALSVAMMTAEVVLTRIFSATLGYHFAFFAISVALFGVGVASVLVHVLQRTLLAAESRARLSWFAGLLALSLVVADFCLVRLGSEWSRHPPTSAMQALGEMLALFALAALPFFVGGLTVCLAMSRNAANAPRLYAADLAGAALGCLAVVPLLGALGGPGALVGAAAFAGVASVFFMLSEPRSETMHSRLGVVVAGLAIVAGAALHGAGALEVRAAKGIDLTERRPEWTRWNSFSMVSVLPVGGFRGWGLSPRYSGPFPEQKTLLIDLGAATMLNRFDGTPASAAYALFDLSAIVYRLRPAPGEICVIGAGGGKDVLAAVQAGAKHVTGVEINPLIVDGVVRGAYRDYTGNLYGRPGIDIVIEDGRTFVRRTKQVFDVLLLSMVDTSASTGAGAYSLTENSLYTSDAFADFYSRLAPDGIFSVSSVTLEGIAVGARLVSIARDALERSGHAPSRSIALLQTNWVGTTATLHDLVVKPAGFSDDEVSTLRTAAQTLGFSIGYLPGDPPGPGLENEGVHLIATAPAETVRQAIEAWPLDVSPVNDSRPFFFYQSRLRDIPAALLGVGAHGTGLAVLAKVLVVALFMVFLFLLGPLVFFRSEPGVRRASRAELAYVACLGLGFMFVEIGVLQRFSIYLGQPTYSLVIVLFVLLVFGALGSRLSPSLALAGRPQAALAFFGGIAALVVVLELVLPSLLRATAPWPFAARAMACTLAVAPLGFALGVPLPTGLARVGERSSSPIPWLWAMNSATSVLGSVLATFVAIHLGIDASLGTGAACYAVAGLFATKVLA
jgi:hypothetical protein